MLFIKHLTELSKFSANSFCGYCDILGPSYLGHLGSSCILFIFVSAEPSSVPSTQETLQKKKKR